DFVFREGAVSSGDVAGHRSLQTAEAEIEIAFQFGRIAIAMRQPRRRQRYGAVVAALRQLVDDRSTRIAEAEQLRDLVVRLPRRVVARPAEKLVTAGAIDAIQAGVAAGDDQNDRRQRKFT